MQNLRLDDRAAAAAAPVEGWLSERQGRALLAAALATTGRGAIVEVGSWKGRSTIWLAFGARERGRRVLAVDPHCGSREDPSARTLDAFLGNLASAGVADAVEPLVMTSAQAVHTITEPVELLFVDGDHGEAGARLDADLWLPKVLPGGTVLFHDVATSGYIGPTPRVPAAHLLESRVPSVREGRLHDGGPQARRARDRGDGRPRSPRGAAAVSLRPAGNPEAGSAPGADGRLPSSSSAYHLTMSAHLIEGTRIAADIRASVAPEVEAFAARAGRPPCLGIVLVGDDPASEIYVRNKVKAGTESGIRVDLQRLGGRRAARDLLALVARLNASDAHDGILVQAPLPPAMGRGASQQVFDAIDPAKDVDGFNPVSVGRLVQGRALLAPCTPSGVIEMLDRSGIAIAGRRAVIIGRSEIVGKPMAMLLLQRDATVTICHSKTADLAVRGARGRHPGGGHRACRLRHAGVREAGRDGRRRRDQPGGRRRRGRTAVRGRLDAGWPTSPGAVRSSSATCIRRWRRSPAR